MTVERIPFGTTREGGAVEAVRLSTSTLIVEVINYGATVTKILVPDYNGNIDNVVLGFDNLQGYENCSAYIGCTVGRFANRIAGANFDIDGVNYRLQANDGDSCLHGGQQGFDKRLWQISSIKDEESTASVTLNYLSPDFEEGFPGNLDVEVTFVVYNDALAIKYRAVTDKATPVNLSNHSYFNLARAGKGNVLDHRLIVSSLENTAVDSNLIPTGEILSVRSTPFDFTEPTAIGERFDRLTNGYDQNLVLLNYDGQCRKVAELSESITRRKMEVWTTEPGMQLYTGGNLDGTGNGGTYGQYSGLCLEAQHYPDSVHHPNFPNTVLHPGEVYKQLTVYRFSA